MDSTIHFSACQAEFAIFPNHHFLLLWFRIQFPELSLGQVWGVWRFTIASMALFFVLACLGVVAFGSICENYGVHLADEKHLGGIDPAALSWAFSLVTTILPASLLTFAYCLFAKRLNVGRKWMLASCAALALIAMLPIQSILIFDMPGKSLWSIGLGFPPSLSQCIQLLVPVAIGLWFVRHNDRQASRKEPLRMAA